MEKDPMLQPYWWCDLEIPIVRIEAKNAEHAEYIMQRFIDKIGLIMTDKVFWNDCDWEIKENVYDPETGSWVTQ
jgi:hypothetical protein